MLAVCKRLNPNVEVPEVGDLVQHISDMVESDNTEKTITIHEIELTKALGLNSSTSYDFCVRTKVAYIYFIYF